MVGNGHVMMACLESGGPCDSWWSVVGGTNGWQLVANGRLKMKVKLHLFFYYSGITITDKKFGFEGQILSINIGIGIIGTDKKFGQRKWGYTNETKLDDIIRGDAFASFYVCIHLFLQLKDQVQLCKEQELPPNAVASIIDGLKRLYIEKPKPLEVAHLSRTVILLLNPWSSGSIFNWKDKFYKLLLKCNYPGAHIGPEPTKDRFFVVMEVSFVLCCGVW
nr:eh domain-containing protein 1 [Quercus suber]